ncbi:MAG: hypothetical protein DIZ80_03200 [endosymbiont of Galathealinum brachiosum]|uniref:Uncharacterized protein n=1 Tax=endosymbiont of Galathealinum brachiosum TaxID=2200906 RepID=A0A370DIX0_9GAMM|nr:MAG: hypothetical protein DIZ80_03200 [endosymbiont of Galathealinum brachiosum]
MYKFILVGLLFLSIQANATKPVKKLSLPLVCATIPSIEEQLCYSSTNSSYGPYDDVVFYKIDKYGEEVLLGSQSGGVATFGGFDFSLGGRYMWVSWAEEGHPFFEFYRTNDFLENGIKSKSLEVLGDYYFEQFTQFSENGNVAYSLTEGAFENCKDAGDGARESIDSETSKKNCIKQFNIESDKN